jgi:hypothetical protein
MITGTYRNLVKPLSIGDVNQDDHRDANVSGGSDILSKGIRLSGRRHLEGMKLDFSWETCRSVGNLHPESGRHVHPYAECLFFAGLDTANVNYLGAEIDIVLGEEHCLFNDPVAIVIPPGLPHGSVAVRKMFSPRGIGFFTIALNHEATPVRTEQPPFETTSSPASRTYAHLVKPLKSGLITERGRPVASRFSSEQLAEREVMAKRTGLKPGPGNTDHMTWMFGRDLENLDLNVAWGFASQPGIWQRGVTAHSHPEDEVLIFIGTDPDNIDYLGAEIEIDLGREHERYLFDRSSAIICPANIPHGPIVTRWVDRPFAFLLINLAGDMNVSFEPGPATVL